MMKQLAVILAIIATAQAFGPWKGGLKVRFGLSPIHFGRSYYIPMPRSVAEAKNARWVLTPRPEGPMPSLVMYCPSLRDRVLCCLYDDTAYIAGMQIAVPEDQFKDGIFDWEVQGFTKWSPPPSTLGVQTHYWTIQQYFISEAYLAVSPADRIAERNPDKTIQFENVWVTGFNKELMAISTDARIIADTARSRFTKQACIPLMGRHYYYNMTATTECTAESLLPWFPLVHSGELIGMGAVIFGKLDEKSMFKDYFERPPPLAVKVPEDQFKDGIFDWEVQGFTKWSPPPSTLGVQTHYWTIQQYFISEAYLAVSPADRIAERNPDKTIQFENVWVTGFNKELMAISTDARIIADTARSRFTKQACIPLMGRHYYYNMTATTECTAESLLPWFPLVHSGELIGMGAVIFGKLDEKSMFKDYFERPPPLAVKTIVPDGPQCLYNLADNPMMITMHAYYINTPWLVDCLLQ